MRICSIASGSSGNCTYVGSGDTNILIDAGVSRKRIVEGLKKIGVAPEQLNGIFVTPRTGDMTVYAIVPQKSIGYRTLLTFTEN